MGSGMEHGIVVENLCRDFVYYEKEAGIKNITDDIAIKEMINKVISENPDSVADYKAGKDRAIKYLMGQVMKESKGTLNPSMAMNILKEELNK